MRKLIFILFAFWCFSCFGQDLTRIKHIELISEVKDTMIMINKEDADKINKTYFLKNQLDTINCLNEKIISELKVKSLKQENIIKEQQEIVDNYKKIVKEQKDQNEKLIKDYDNFLKKSQRRKAIWQGIGIGEAIGIILLICFL